MKTIMGIFSDMSHADMAFAALAEEGFDTRRISAITKDVNVEHTKDKGVVQNVTSSGVTGAVTGGAIGGIAGILIAAGTLAIPGIGTLLVGGPLVAALGITGGAATAVTTALTGAVAGGAVGILTGLGLPESSAKIYSERIKEGAVVLSVETDEESEPSARKILADHMAETIETISSR